MGDYRSNKKTGRIGYKRFTNLEQSMYSALGLDVILQA